MSGRSVGGRPLLSLAIVVLLAGCGASATPTPATTVPSASPAVTPPPSMAPGSPAVSATPAAQAQSVAPASWAHVTGTETVQIVEGPTESGGMLHLRSTTVDTMSDPRVTGTGTVIETITGDPSTGLGLQQSTYSLKNAGGTWFGATCAGAEWDSGSGANITCWLTGGGGYAGLTYYLNLREATPGSLVLDGLIYPGSPPAH